MAELEKLSDGKFTDKQWVRCLGHILNLAVQDYLKAMKASVNIHRDKQAYLRDTSRNIIAVEEDEDEAFVKVRLFILMLATCNCC